jgi:hypothetical protein
MKTCPSCGSELADDAKECLCGYTYEDDVVESEDLADAAEAAEAEAEADAGLEPSFEEPDFDAGPSMGAMPEEPMTKHCVFCGSEIHAYAARCPHCSGFLPIAEGTAYRQHFFFLFSCVAIFIGTLLPWERTYLKANLTGADAIGGGLLLALTAYGIIASFWNIYHRKMIVWPVLLAAVDGAVLGWQRVLQVYSDFQPALTAEQAFGRMVQNVQQHVRALGPGLYLVTGFSTLVLLSVFVSVFKGAKQDAARKSMEREARAEARKTRRSGR